MGRAALSRLLFGAEPKLRRMMYYWGATAAMYTVFVGLLIDAGQRQLIDQGDALRLAVYTATGIVASYLIVRLGARFGLAPPRCRRCSASAATCGRIRLPGPCAAPR